MNSFEQLRFEIEFESEFDQSWNEFDNQPHDFCFKTLDPIYLEDGLC